MKKNLTFAAFAFMAFTLIGCNGSTQKDSTENSDSLSINETENVEKVDDTTDAEVTPLDVAFFDLKGMVKKCTLKKEYSEIIYEFDKDGNFVKCTQEYEETVNVSRDSQGRINRIQKKDQIDRTWTDEYEYDNEGRITKASCNAMPDGLSFEHNYTYKDGRIASLKGWNDGPGKLEITFDYISEDDHGNWTERTKSTLVEGEDEPNVETEKRVIEYY